MWRQGWQGLPDYPREMAMGVLVGVFVCFEVAHQQTGDCRGLLVRLGEA